MTTYYGKAFDTLDKTVYDVNPAGYIGISKYFGRLNVPLNDPWQDDFIDFKVAQKASAMGNGRKLNWADSESKLVSGKIPLMWFYWSTTLTLEEMRSIQNNPNSMFAQQVKAELQAQQSNFAFNYDKYLSGTLATTNATTDPNYSPDWTGAFKPVAGSGTPSEPASCESTPGTETDLTAVQFTGASASVDAIANSFGAVRNVFFQQYDTTTGESMYHGTNVTGGPDGDTFHVLAHPAAWATIKSGCQLSAAATQDYTQNYIDAMVKQGFTPIGTMAVDAAYDGASGTAANMVMVMNWAENFQIIEAVPYTVEPWIEMFDPQRGQVFRKRGYCKSGVFKRPWYLNSTYKKACASFKCDPKADA